MAKRRRFSEEAFGATVQRLMDEQGVTYRQLAARTGLSAGYLNHLVHGNRPVPSNDVVATLAGRARGRAGALPRVPAAVITERLEAMPALIDRLYRQLNAHLAEPVAEEQVRAVRPHRTEPSGDPRLWDQLDAFDEAETGGGAAAPRAAARR